MFKKIFKKEEAQYTPEISQNEDWTKDIRRSLKMRIGLRTLGEVKKLVVR